MMKRKNEKKKGLIYYWLLVCVQVVLAVLIGLGAFIYHSQTQVSGGFNDTELSNNLETAIHTNFINEIAPLAQNAQKKYHVLSSITLGQACLESDWGQSGLSQKYHNLFGIKAYGNVPTIKLDTQEYENGEWITIKGEFRVYDSYAASVNGHSELFTEGTTWNPNQYESVLKAKDYITAAKAVQSSGYATDPDYADKLIAIIQKYDLEKYDKL